MTTSLNIKNSCSSNLNAAPHFGRPAQILKYIFYLNIILFISYK